MNRDTGISTSDQGIFGEETMSDSELEYAGSSCSPRFTDFDRWQAQTGLKKFGEGIQAAATAVFPSAYRNPYPNADVLMLNWDQSIPVEVTKLSEVFKNIFHYDVELWNIPYDNSDAEVALKVSDFVHQVDDGEPNLKIVFYTGDASLDSDRRSIWTSTKTDSVVEWSKIQSTLESSDSDVLVLLDCPHLTSSQHSTGGGVTELIAASSHGATKGDPLIFTRELELELRELSRLPSFSVGNLYHNIFARFHNRMCHGDVEYSAPVYSPLLQDRASPRSIRLSVHQPPTDFKVAPEHEATTNGFSSAPSFLHSSAVVPGEMPRMAFALRLNPEFQTGTLPSDLFQQLLGHLPSSVAEVKIEAGIHTQSPLLVVSMPICLSIYMPKDPAIMNLGPILSNQVPNHLPIPRDLPTPEPDNHSWDHLKPLSPARKITPSIKLTNGPHGVSKTGIRFEKIPHDKETRPPLRQRNSSIFSSASSDDEPFAKVLNHARTVNGIDPESETRSIPAFGPHESEANGPQSKAHAKIHTYSDEGNAKKFPRISRPVELLRKTYDCVVIGSGYGGAVAASRMARAGQSVCLLERGKEKWPGEYPSGFVDAMEELHVSGDFAPGWLTGAAVEGGDPTGLYHLICGKGQNAFVGNGLGGTSLLNANIFLEADDGTMQLPCWPEELRHKGSLDEYYKRAADVLEPQSYPKDWPELPKLSLLKRQAEALGWADDFKRPRQTTRFKGGPNSTGVEMYPSALTGQDSTGINDGSKSSTLVNYLADAWNWGAEMFCECEVRYIKKHPNPNKEGYLVFFAWHGSKRGAFEQNLYEDLMWVYAEKCVFLGAGSIGTTEILLRSKKLGLSMSDKVGQGMSGNGDILAFGYNTDTEVNAIGRQYPSPYKPVGPTITGLIDRRKQDNPLDGFVIEEGAIPKALAPLFQTMLEMMPGNQVPKGEGLINKVKHVLAQQGSRFLGPYFSKGSIERTQVYLIMSHDSNQAILTLKDDKPHLEFLGVGKSEHVHYLNDILKQATQAVGGTFVNSPFYAALGQQEITVHPIGGACMSFDGTGEHGVTNHFGEVFTSRGEETHHGLIVTDAAVIPTCLGVNPFATITALAERSVEHAARDRILEAIDLDAKNDILDLFGSPGQFADAKKNLRRKDTQKISDATKLVHDTRERHANGFGFSEVMSGYIHVGDGIEGDQQEDYQTAAKTAKGLCEEARFFLSVRAWDTEIIVNRADHRAMLTGTFTCGSLPGSPFMVQRGDFHLFSVDQQAPGTKNLTYDFDMRGTDNKKYHFHGFKVVDSSVSLAPWRFWSAASTLYVTITEATGEKKVLGRGMLHIKLLDFLSEVLTLQSSGKNLLSKIQSSLSFMGYFAKQSAGLFLSPLTWQQYPSVQYTGYINDTSPDRTIEIIASDGIRSLMHVWEPRNDSIEPINLFMVPGASVDQQIFALPTIEVNAVNYFTRAGYRVYVPVHRICMLMIAENNWTTYDARLDIKACLEEIRREHGPDPIYSIVHCMGAATFSTGMLDGTIPASWIKGITASQVFMNPIWSALNMAKVIAGPIPFDKLYSMLAGKWFSCSSTRDDSYFQQLLNQVLRFYPDRREEICNNVSCHRCSLIFGRLWNHRNLNEATHRQINRFFGGVNTTLLHLLMQMGHRGCVTSNGPLFKKLTEPVNIRRLKGIPMMLFSGSDNKVLTPESTDCSYSILRDTFGTKDYERHVIQGYGHLDCWMGREAYIDVYPLVREQVDRVCRGEDYRYREPDWKKDWNTWRNVKKNV